MLHGSLIALEQVKAGDTIANYLMGHVPYQIFKIILSISSKNMKQCLIILEALKIR